MSSKIISAKSSNLAFRLDSEYVTASFFLGTFYILLKKEVSQEKNWENKGMNFCKYLVKLHRTNYCFYQKEVLL